MFLLFSILKSNPLLYILTSRCCVSINHVCKMAWRNELYFWLKPRCKELASNIFQITCEIVFNLKLIHVHYIHRIKALLNLLSPQWCYTYWLFSFILNKFKLNLLYKKSKSPQFFQPMDFRTSKSLNRVTKQIFPISVKNSLCR